MQRIPTSLLKLSRDVVMHRHPKYYQDVVDIDIDHLGLVSENDIETLLRDQLLNRILGDDEDVLNYLLVKKPEIGMMYGARYGMKRLFHAAKRSYFKKHKFANWRQAGSVFKKFIYERIFPHAIKSDSTSIFKRCLMYMSDEYDIPVKKILKIVLLHDAFNILEYLINEDVSNLQLALKTSTKYRIITVVEALLSMLSKQQPNEFVISSLNAGITIAIERNYYDVFELYLDFKLNNTDDVEDFNDDTDNANMNAETNDYLNDVINDKMHDVMHVDDDDDDANDGLVKDGHIDGLRDGYVGEYTDDGYVIDGLGRSEESVDGFVNGRVDGSVDGGSVNGSVDLSRALKTAAYNNRLTMVNELLRRNAKDDNGDGLSYALYHKNKEMLRSLLERFSYEPEFLIHCIDMEIKCFNTDNLDTLLHHVPKVRLYRDRLLDLAQNNIQLYKYIKRNFRDPVET